MRPAETSSTAAGVAAGELDALAELVAQRLGLGFLRQRRDELARGIGDAARELGIASAGECVRRLLDGPWDERHTAALAARLTVGETYFFRDPAIIARLRHGVLPALVQARANRRLHLWSVGCATGEEAYTLAMLLDMAIPDVGRWDISILGTDINPSSLEAARQGVYREWSFRGVPADIRQRFFRAHRDGGSEVRPELRRSVRFVRHNLADGTLPLTLAASGPVDLILCRNVLMYFDQRQADAALGRLAGALAPDGWLALDPLGARPPGDRLDAVDVGLYRRAPTYRQPPAIAAPRQKPPPSAAAAPALPRRAAVQAAGTAPVEEGTLERVRSRYRAGRYEDAKRMLAGHLAEAPADADALALLARTCANSGSLAAASRWVRRARAVSNLDAGTHYIEAAIQLELGAPDEARAALERALFLSPGFALAHVAMAKLARDEGRPAKALKHLAAAQAVLDAAAPDAAHDALDGIDTGRLKGAVDALRQVIAGGRC